MAKVTIHTWAYEGGKVGYNLKSVEGNDTFGYLFLDQAKDGGSAEYLLPEGFEVRYDKDGNPTIYDDGGYPTAVATTAYGKPGLRTSADVSKVIPLERIEKTVTIHKWVYEDGSVGHSLWSAEGYNDEWSLEPATDGGSAEYLLLEGFEVRYSKADIPCIYYGEYPVSVVTVDGNPGIRTGANVIPLEAVKR